MRFPLVLAAILLVPLVAAGPLPELTGDEFVTLPPTVTRADPPPIMPPGLCHAPAIDLTDLAVANGPQALVVSLSVVDAASRAFSCPDLADDIERPGYTVEFYTSRAAYAGIDAPRLLLTSSREALRCWGYVPGFFYPIQCDYALDGNTMTWTIARSDVPPMSMAAAYPIARGEAAAGAYWIQDLAE